MIVVESEKTEIMYEWMKYVETNWANWVPKYSSC